jgi:hypothetical protein
MPTEAKRETVAELRDELSRSRTLIVSEYRGLTVKEIAEIRRALRRQDVRYRVVKNRPDEIAAQDGVGEALNPLLTGPSAIAFGTDEAATAKAVIDATTPYNRIVRITGGVLGDRRSTPTRDPPRQRSRRARSSWRSWPAACRRRSAQLAGLFAPRCATWATPCSRSPSRRPRPRARSSHDHRTTPRPTSIKETTSMATLTQTTCSRRSTR